jgi:P pilus assembly protein, chaperone PapD
MKRIHTVVLRLCALVALGPAALAAQGVLVAPTGIFIDSHTRGGSVELYNPGADPVEVSISTAFGYPVSDSLGRITLYLDSAPDSTRPSAAAWVDAYPRRLIMRPRERRTVRLFVRPPANLPDGEYWSRLIVDAKGGQVAVQSPASSSGIQVGLALEVRTIVGVFYRKGRASTGVEMSGARARVSHDSLTVCARFTRQGSAAFLGAMHATLTDRTGKQVASLSSPLAVYYTLAPCVQATVPALVPGRYVVHLLVDTNRDDLKREALLPITPVRDSLVITVPASR